MDYVIRILKKLDSVMQVWADVAAGQAPRTQVQVPGGFIFLGQDGRYEEFQLDIVSLISDWNEDGDGHEEPESTTQAPPKPREKMFFETFDRCIDEFFSLAESHRAEREAEKRTRAGEKKLEAVARDQEARVEALQNLIQTQDLAASTLEEHAEEADAALAAVNQCLAQGMEWTEIASLIEAEAADGNPIAALIDKLDLSNNRIVLKLLDSIKVDLDLSLSAMSNVQQLHKERKRAQAKEIKTLEASAAAQTAAKLKVERDAARISSRVASAGPLSVLRKHLWFEKFRWFLSSEGYIIIAGRDAQQNELVVKRYLWRGGGANVYVHADLHGAASCVILNSKKDEEVTPKTLNEAGVFCVCHSAAWDAKIVTSAWWVYAHQVSKTAPSGEYLSTGSFLIRGKKNYLPPCPLVMGFGILFRLDDASAADRREKRLAAEEAEKQEEPKQLHRHQGHSGDAGENAADEDLSPSGAIEDDAEVQIEEDGSSVEDADGSGSHENTPDREEYDESANGEAVGGEGGNGDDVEGESSKDDGEEPGDVGAEGDLTNDGPKEASEDEADSMDSILDQLNMDRISISSSPKVAATPPRPSDEPKDSANNGKYEWQGAQSNKAVYTKKVTPTRGKKSKAKKMKEKYADQDEEDRALRMAILGSAGTRKSKKAKAKAEMEQKKASTEVKEEVTRLGVATNEEVMEQRRQAIEEEKAAAAARAQARPGQDDNDEDDDDTVDENNEDFAQTIEIRDSMTAIPGAEEEFLYALPMCGPYNAMQSFKYKVKLTPGSMKKGKVAKAAVDLCSQMDTSATRERELIKKITDPEMVQQLPGLCKVSVAGLSKLTHDSKKQKKKKR